MLVPILLFVKVHCDIKLGKFILSLWYDLFLYTDVLELSLEI